MKFRKVSGGILFFVVLCSIAYAEIEFTPNPVNSGEELEINIETDSTFYYRLYVYDGDGAIVDIINAGCPGYDNCESQKIEYMVPLDWESDKYLLRVYDYGANRWEGFYFYVKAKAEEEVVEEEARVLACIPIQETCDGFDNDCDEIVDNNVTGCMQENCIDGECIGEYKLWTLSDTHFGYNAPADYKQIWPDIWNERLDNLNDSYDIGAMLGDIVENSYQSDEIAKLDQIIEDQNLQEKLYVILGNHDIINGGRNPAVYNYYIANMSQTNSTNYTVSFGNVLFIAMGDEHISYSGAENEGLSIETYEWFNKTVAENQDKIIVVWTHRHPAFLMTWMPLPHSDKIQQTLNDYHVDVWYYGHTHGLYLWQYVFESGKRTMFVNDGAMKTSSTTNSLSSVMSTFSNNSDILHIERARFDNYTDTTAEYADLGEYIMRHNFCYGECSSTYCDSDADCSIFSRTNKCDTINHECAACLDDADCDIPLPACSTSFNPRGECAECSDDSYCTDPAYPACKNNECIRCTSDSHCTSPSAPFCVNDNCRICVDDSGCTGNVNGEYCINNYCKPCVDDAGCSGNPAGEFCINNYCKPCVNDLDCSGNPNGEYCVNNNCRKCIDDADCSGNPAGEYCSYNNCVKCKENTHCTDTNLPACVGSKCRECSGSVPCSDPDFPYCTGFSCGSCLNGTDCVGNPDGPYCISNNCAECISHDECDANEYCWVDNICKEITCSENKDCEDFDDCSLDKCENGFCNFTKYTNSDDCYYCADFSDCNLNGGFNLCGGADIDHNGTVEAETDLTIFSIWHNSGLCGEFNNYCDYADINRHSSGFFMVVGVNVADLNLFLPKLGLSCNLEPWRACELGISEQEICDGFDNDCDGDVDNGGDILCDDGVYCNGAETCSGGSCQAGTPPACSDAVGCTTDSCNETTDSCDNMPNNALCDDSLYCNGEETCDDLLDCQNGVAPSVNDSVGCTIDNCDEVNDVITHTADDSYCLDGLWCNGNEYCDSLLDCQLGSTPECDDGIDCTVNNCDEGVDLSDDIGSCEYDTTPCDCTIAGPAPVECDDGNSCTDDVCNAQLTCENVNNDTNSCDDGFYCTIDDRCSAGSCIADSRPIDDNVSCTLDSCDDVNDVVVNIPDNSLCDDTLYCNGEETCDALLDCQNGVAPDCSYLTDQCNLGICNETNNMCIKNYSSFEGVSCEDGDLCNIGETCQSGTCTGGSPPDCSYLSDQCNNGICNPSDGTCFAQPANEGITCNDGVDCTDGDICSSGDCAGTANDSNCESWESCNPISGCGQITCSNCQECDGWFDGCDYTECHEECNWQGPCYFIGIIAGDNCVNLSYACDNLISDCSDYSYEECNDDLCNLNCGWNGSECGAHIDDDNDGIENNADNCVNIPNPLQEDLDNDGIGDVCDDDIDGDYINNTEDQCPLRAAPATDSRNKYGCPPPIWDKFKNKLSTNLSNLSIYHNISLRLGISKKGLINFTQNVNVGGVDLDKYVKIEKTYVEINSSAIPELNKSAIVTLFNVSDTELNNPQILKDDSLCEGCSIISYINNTFTFNVSHFTRYSIGIRIDNRITGRTIYEVVEGPYCGDGACDGDERCSSCSADCGECDAGGGSGGGGGGGSRGGGGGGGGGGGVPSKINLDLEPEFFTSGGYAVKQTQGDSASFKLGEVEYVVELLRLRGDSVTVKVGGQSNVFNIKDLVEFDVNNDGVKDIFISLKAIVGGRAEILYKKLAGALEISIGEEILPEKKEEVKEEVIETEKEDIIKGFVIRIAVLLALLLLSTGLYYYRDEISLNVSEKSKILSGKVKELVKMGKGLDKSKEMELGKKEGTGLDKAKGKGLGKVNDGGLDKSKGTELGKVKGKEGKPGKVMELGKVKKESNLESRFRALFEKTEKLLQDKEWAKAENNYLKLYSIYKKINNSSLPDPVKVEVYRKLEEMYSKLSKIIRK